MKKWEITYLRGVFEKLFYRQRSLPARTEWLLMSALADGTIKEILKEMRDKPLPHTVYLYVSKFHFTIIFEVHYKKRELAIVDVKHGKV